MTHVFVGADVALVFCSRKSMNLLSHIIYVGIPHDVTTLQHNKRQDLYKGFYKEQPFTSPCIGCFNTVYGLADVNYKFTGAEYIFFTGCKYIVLACIFSGYFSSYVHVVRLKT